MHLRLTGVVAPLLLLQACPVGAGDNAWTRSERQGFVEYHYADSRSGSTMTIGCDEAASDDHSGTGIYLEIGGLLPPHAQLRVAVDGTAVTVPSDRSGGISSHGCPECADRFAQLWPMLRKGRTAEIAASDGRRASFPLRGLARLMPAEPCPAGTGADRPRREAAQGTAAVPAVASAPAGGGGGLDDFLGGLLPECAGSDEFEAFRSTLAERYGFTADGKRRNPGRELAIPAAVRPSMGTPTASNHGEYTKIVVPVTGSFRSLKVRTLVFVLGNENGINSMAVLFAEPIKRVRSVLRADVADGTRRFKAALKRGDAGGSIAIGTVDGRPSLICDLSV